MRSSKQILFVYVIPICVFCLTYNLPKFFELTVEYSACNSMTKEENIGQGYDPEEYFYEMEDCKEGVRAELMVRKYQMTNSLFFAELTVFRLLV